MISLKNDFDESWLFYRSLYGRQKATDLLLAEGKGDNYLVLIGPEGDFTSREVEHSIESGFRTRNTWNEPAEDRNCRRCGSTNYKRQDVSETK